jgi:hypothetical protein
MVQGGLQLHFPAKGRAKVLEKPVIAEIFALYFRNVYLLDRDRIARRLNRGASAEKHQQQKQKQRRQSKRTILRPMYTSP